VSLELSSTAYGDLAMVGVAGPVVGRTAPKLQRSLAGVLATRPQAVILDLALVTRLDQPGLGALLHTASRCTHQGCVLALCRVPDHVAALLTAERVAIPRYATLADATETLLYAAAWR
jgi:anti-anti-sigma factor